MPSGYTAPVKDGEVTDLKDFATACARAFGAFIHQRDDGYGSGLHYPENPRSGYYQESLNAARMNKLRWEELPEEQKYAKWSEYYKKTVSSGIKVKAEDKVTRARYESMLAQLHSVDAPNELTEFKKFMIDQLTESLDFDCHDGDEFFDNYYTPSEYVEWCETEEKSLVRDEEYYEEQLAKEKERYEERVRYINLMVDTYGIEVK